MTLLGPLRSVRVAFREYSTLRHFVLYTASIARAEWIDGLALFWKLCNIECNRTKYGGVMHDVVTMIHPNQQRRIWPPRWTSEALNEVSR